MRSVTCQMPCVTDVLVRQWMLWLALSFLRHVGLGKSRWQVRTARQWAVIGRKVWPLTGTACASNAGGVPSWLMYFASSVLVVNVYQILSALHFWLPPACGVMTISEALRTAEAAAVRNLAERASGCVVASMFKVFVLGWSYWFVAVRLL